MSASSAHSYGGSSVEALHGDAEKDLFHMRAKHHQTLLQLYHITIMLFQCHSLQQLEAVTCNKPKKLGQLPKVM